MILLSIACISALTGILMVTSNKATSPGNKGKGKPAAKASVASPGKGSGKGGKSGGRSPGKEKKSGPPDKTSIHRISNIPNLKCYTK